MRQKVQTQQDMMNAAGGMLAMAIAAVIGIAIMAKLNVWVGLVILVIAILAFAGNMRLFQGKA